MPGNLESNRLTLKERLDFRRLIRGGRPVEGPVRLNHQLIFIIPNKRGFGFGFLLTIQWLTAINYENNLAFILTFLLAGIAMLGIFKTFSNLSGIEVSVRQNQPVFVGDQAGFEVLLANQSALPRYAVWLKSGQSSPVKLDIPASHSEKGTLGIKATRRGWLDPGPITVFSEFPLGLFYAWSPLNFTARILIYPRPAADFLPFPEITGSGTEAGHLRFNTDELHGFKNYQAGDNIQRIQWRSIAKGQPLQVSLYVENRNDDVHFRLDETPGSDLEAQLSRLCRWITDAETKGLKYSLSLPGNLIPARRGPSHYRECLTSLALFNP